ncbi:MAG: ABC transporter ATP-binding protein [Planctomycetota bacterium]
MTDSASASEKPALEIAGLKFRYAGAASPWIVDVAAFTLAPGEQALVTGPSGAGKSTLLHLIAGLVEPSEGSVRVGGVSVFDSRGGKRDELRGRSIGMIFQTHQLLSGFTAAENVMAGMMFGQTPRSGHRSRAVDLLKRLGVDAPDRAVERLSVGQQQRVAVARAVAGEPSLVLADEPTASLDPESAQASIGLIQEVCRERGAALLCVSHDPSIFESFDRRHAFAELSMSSVGAV